MVCFPKGGFREHSTVLQREKRLVREELEELNFSLRPFLRTETHLHTRQLPLEPLETSPFKHRTLH